uniref:Uncharacterized protein n=1 Tax=Chromera velia CCMP2878 TaxID=1169474 RepID=A0A0G4GIT9_9ALVE|eukprot:Cvel_22041.t1-p1 / transcript=Cvel_22041.t1 / gene=Cvel_22041 / organism=Chromera_velia_CCMP2878 / gene_product=hypothetical protein / transcript_product=hypothetical protein / location=Cvel_scaffold2128:6319-9997(-) / protein_length=903 / sequence_SO=supercontig / SO=protein_coding / is_pseudo=false
MDTSSQLENSSLRLYFKTPPPSVVTLGVEQSVELYVLNELLSPAGLESVLSECSRQQHARGGAEGRGRERERDRQASVSLCAQILPYKVPISFCGALPGSVKEQKNPDSSAETHQVDGRTETAILRADGTGTGYRLVVLNPRDLVLTSKGRVKFSFVIRETEGKIQCREGGGEGMAFLMLSVGMAGPPDRISHTPEASSAAGKGGRIVSVVSFPFEVQARKAVDRPPRERSQPSETGRGGPKPETPLDHNRGPRHDPRDQSGPRQKQKAGKGGQKARRPSGRGREGGKEREKEKDSRNSSSRSLSLSLAQTPKSSNPPALLPHSRDPGIPSFSSSKGPGIASSSRGPSPDSVLAEGQVPLSSISPDSTRAPACHVEGVIPASDQAEKEEEEKEERQFEEATEEARRQRKREEMLSFLSSERGRYRSLRIFPSTAVEEQEKEDYSQSTEQKGNVEVSLDPSPSSVFFLEAADLASSLACRVWDCALLLCETLWFSSLPLPFQLKTSVESLVPSISDPGDLRGGGNEGGAGRMVSALVRGKRCLELGAGTGAVGMVAARLGALEVVCTDKADATDVLAANLNFNFGTETGRKAQILGKELDWGSLEMFAALEEQRGGRRDREGTDGARLSGNVEQKSVSGEEEGSPETPSIPTVCGSADTPGDDQPATNPAPPFDVVILSDVLYDECHFPPLLSTILAAGGDAGALSAVSPGPLSGPACVEENREVVDHGEEGSDQSSSMAAEGLAILSARLMKASENAGEKSDSRSSGSSLRLPRLLIGHRYRDPAVVRFFGCLLSHYRLFDITPDASHAVSCGPREKTTVEDFEIEEAATLCQARSKWKSSEQAEREGGKFSSISKAMASEEMKHQSTESHESNAEYGKDCGSSSASSVADRGDLWILWGEPR